MLVQPPDRSRRRQFLLFFLGGGVVVYAAYVLIHVGASHEFGLPSILTPHLLGEPQGVEAKNGQPLPQSGDLITKVGDLDIKTWADLLQAPGILHRKVEEPGFVAEWLKQEATGPSIAIEYMKVADAGSKHEAWVRLARFPLEEMIPSLIWLLIKGALFVIGAMVYWKRPNDEAAERFYILCVVTLGAYIGGYHWAQIVTHPVLSIIFMACAVMLPVASLHFYLVFPHKKTWLERYPCRTLAVVYGLPVLNLACLIGFFVYVRLPAGYESSVREYLPALIYASFGTAAIWYLACMAVLFHSVRTVEDSTERKQVRCILIGVFFSHFPIGHSLYIVLVEPARFVEGAVTWPMFGASFMVTLAFAIGMTRYRLMELDKVITSGMGYFLVSFLAGLMYYAVVFVGTLFYGHIISSSTLPAALTVSTAALIFVFVLDAARSRIQAAVDRRFSRNKYQLDRTLEQMSHAVSQLVDPPALAQRLLTAVTDSLGIARGAIYLRHEAPAGFRLAAHLGEQPVLIDLPTDAPLIEAMRRGLGLECPYLAEGAGTPAQKQMRALGGDVAQPLLSEGELLAVLVLGDKETPFRAEDWSLLSAFAQITVVALESAAKHRAIEGLNQDLQAKVEKIAEQQRRILALQTQLHRQAVVKPAAPRPVEAEIPPAPNIGGIVGSSPVVRQLLSVVRKVAVTDAVVLLRGESGTGKELLARAVHETSPRAARPYVKVHCAALSANLLESELFGHVKGAYTGAHKDKIGRFELANTGTLFLDEIGDISLEVQTKLLRVLQEKTIERVGSSETLSVDVRIIAATHQDLEELIRRGRFREDLFYRLNVFPIRVPALRERLEDIPELAGFFVKLSSERCKKNVTQIDDDALARLKSYDWPGNIRQLENTIERAVVIAEGSTLTMDDLPAELFQAELNRLVTIEPVTLPADESLMPTSNFRNERDRFEREQLVRALAAAAGNKAEAARILGVARTTLISRMKKLGIKG